jgi:hypothetical protein
MPALLFRHDLEEHRRGLLTSGARLPREASKGVCDVRTASLSERIKVKVLTVALLATRWNMGLLDSDGRPINCEVLTEEQAAPTFVDLRSISMPAPTPQSCSRAKSSWASCAPPSCWGASVRYRR